MTSLQILHRLAVQTFPSSVIPCRLGQVFNTYTQSDCDEAMNRITCKRLCLPGEGMNVPGRCQGEANYGHSRRQADLKRASNSYFVVHSILGAGEGHVQHALMENRVSKALCRYHLRGDKIQSLMVDRVTGLLKEVVACDFTFSSTTLRSGPLGQRI